MVATGTQTMAKKTMTIRVDDDIYRMLDIICRAEAITIKEWVSKRLRPILLRELPKAGERTNEEIARLTRPRNAND